MDADGNKGTPGRSCNKNVYACAVSGVHFTLQ